MVGFFFLVSSRVMYLFIAIAVIAVVLLMLRKRGDVPVSVCEQIIEASKKYEFMDTPENVDDKPMGEIAIYDDGRPINVELWNMCKKYYETVASKHNLDLTYAFLRKYDTGARNDLIMHLDDEEDPLEAAQLVPLDSVQLRELVTVYLLRDTARAPSAS